MGTGVERSRVAVAGPRLVECGTNGAGSPSTSRPCGPTSVQINREGRTRSGRERGRQSAGSTPQPHIRTQINRTKGGERSRPRNPGLQLREIKPQTSD